MFKDRGTNIHHYYIYVHQSMLDQMGNTGYKKQSAAENKIKKKKREASEKR